MGSFLGKLFLVAVVSLATLSALSTEEAYDACIEAQNTCIDKCAQNDEACIEACEKKHVCEFDEDANINKDMEKESEAETKEEQ